MVQTGSTQFVLLMLQMTSFWSINFHIVLWFWNDDAVEWCFSHVRNFQTLYSSIMSGCSGFSVVLDSGLLVLYILSVHELGSWIRVGLSRTNLFIPKLIEKSRYLWHQPSNVTTLQNSNAEAQKNEVFSPRIISLCLKSAEYFLGEKILASRTHHSCSWSWMQGYNKTNYSTGVNLTSLAQLRYFQPTKKLM